jgi:hypothetical protein
MADPTPAGGAQRASDLAFLAAAREALAAGLDGAALDALQVRLQALAAGPDPVVADAAAIVELRVLGAIMIHQAAELRALAARLTHTARWLPPAQLGQN